MSAKKKTMTPEEVLQARFIRIDQALADSLVRPYCPDSLRALRRYLAG